jgi:hypothetical protein
MGCCDANGNFVLDSVGAVYHCSIHRIRFRWDSGKPGNLVGIAWTVRLEGIWPGITGIGSGWDEVREDGLLVAVLMLAIIVTILLLTL